MFASLILLFSILLSATTEAAASSDRINGRYSFSLTTFTPNGKLDQVERASRAALLLGTPVIVLCREDSSIVMASPQVLPSPSLMLDDGTSRFARITKDICMTHSGIASDGRLLIAAGQRMAVEHEYTFNEHMEVEVFLEKMSLLMQSYTIKAGSRPFGCALLIASSAGRVYRLDPSGSVSTLGSYGLIGSLSEQLQDKVEQLALSREGASELSTSLTRLLQETMEAADDMSLGSAANKTETLPKHNILAATFTPANGLKVESINKVGDKEL